MQTNLLGYIMQLSHGKIRKLLVFEVKIKKEGIGKTEVEKLAEYESR